MMFGTLPMSFEGTTTKFHLLESSNQLLVTKLIIIRRIEGLHTPKSSSPSKSMTLSDIPAYTQDNAPSNPASQKKNNPRRGSFGATVPVRPFTFDLYSINQSITFKKTSTIFSKYWHDPFDGIWLTSSSSSSSSSCRRAPRCERQPSHSGWYSSWTTNCPSCTPYCFRIFRYSNTSWTNC